MALWTKNGAEPRELPFKDTAPDGRVFTSLDKEPASRAILGWVEAPPRPDPPPGYSVVWDTVGRDWDLVEAPVVDPSTLPLPAEIPMHKARKALRMRGPAGLVAAEEDQSWFELVELAIAAIPNKVQRGAVLDEFTTAPNMVLAGNTTQALKTAIGMSDAELVTVARLALTLP